MYNPVSETLMFQDMHDRTEAMRHARTASTKPAARRWWRTSVAQVAARRTR